MTNQSYDNTKPSDLLEVIGILWKWRKKIVIVGIVAALLSVVITLLLPNYYKGTTSFYAASEDLAKPDPIGAVTFSRNYYGQDRDNDRLFSMAYSDELFNFLIDSFSLYQHYEIDTGKKEAKYLVKQRLSELFDCKKTQYDAIELSIEDKDPGIAASVANAAREKINAFAQDLIKQSQQQLLTASENKIKEKDRLLSIIQDSLIALKTTYKIYDLSTQGEVLIIQKTESQAQLNAVKAKIRSLEDNTAFADSIAYLKALSSGYSSQLNQVNKDLELLNKGFGRVLAMEKELNEFSYQLSLDKERIKQLRSGFSSEFSAVHVVQEAIIPVRKSRPHRSIYVIAITLLSIFAAMIASLSIETYRKVDWKAVLDD